MESMRLHHERRGAGAPLVLLHGLGGTSFVWNPVLERLAAERDVIALDMPGFGRSPRLVDGVPATAANLGEAIASFVAGLGVERPHYAGNSLGAWAALEIAKSDRARSVCAISPAGLWRRPPGPGRIHPRARRWVRALAGVAMLTPVGRARVLRSTLAHPERLTRGEASELVRGWFESAGYEEANREMRAARLEEPELVRCPVTIAWGEHDRLVGPPKPERRPPGSRFLVLEGCGHTPTWDDPERVAELILEASEWAVPGSNRRTSRV